jgi:molybdopterin synthase sulfur carrier subunit
VDSRGPDPASPASASSSNSVSVLYFAALRDLTGTGEERVELPSPPCPVSALLRLLEERHPPLSGRLAAVRVAVNEEFAALDRSVQRGDVIALIPPVSGG